MSISKANNIIYGVGGNIDDINSQPEKKILGNVKFTKWGKKYIYYFSLDIEKGRLLCFKNFDSRKRSTWISLIKAQFKESEENNTLLIKTKKKKNLCIYPIQNIDVLKQLLETCFSTEVKSRTKTFLALMGRGAYKILKLPFKITSGLVFSLEKFSDKAKNPFSGKLKPLKKKKSISNPATGIYVGTSSMLNEVVTAISGLIVEPVKGVKKGGIKGGVTGFGKGIYGLIVKPVAGTIDLVTMTARGVGNMPGTIYRNLFKLKRKKSKKNKPLTEINEDEGMEKFAENDEEILYINKENPFNIEEIKKFTQSYNKNLEIEIDAPKKENKSGDLAAGEEINKMIQFYQKQNSAINSNPDEEEDLCEFIVLQPDHEIDDSSKDSTPSPPKKSIDNTKHHRSIVKEFVTSSNPFSQKSNNSSPSPKHVSNPSDNIDIIYNIENESISDDQSDSGESSDSEEEKEEEKCESSEYESSEEIQELLIKYKVKFPLSKAKCNEIWNIVNKWVPFNSKDDVRCENSFKSGGQICPDPETVKNIRNIGKEIIKEIGRKLLSGNFNLTTVSFPIKSMVPKSALETIFQGTSVFPLYINKASQISNPLERFKLVITGSLSAFYLTNSFGKPLNPYLGETFQGSYGDGTKLYSEQISHHPPISYFFVQGPKKTYSYYGYYNYEAKAGLNSLTFSNKGKRKIRFFDGQEINYNFAEEYYSGTFLGTMKHETLGTITFSDSFNQLLCKIVIGQTKKKPSDYFEGDIIKNEKIVSRVFGTYRGYLEFDGIRYWDYRYFVPYKLIVEENKLLSDHRKRDDLNYLKKGEIKKAQESKEMLEELQRRDFKLRKGEIKKNRK